MNLRVSGLCLIVVVRLTDSLQADEASDQAVAIVRIAVERADQVKLAHWAYTVTALVDGKKTIESHDPSRERAQRWQLLLANGNEPTEKDRKKYSEDRRRRGGGMANRKLGDLIDRTSFRVESQDARQIRCTFQLKVEDEDTRFVIEKLRGTLTVLRQPASLAAVDVVNTERISKPGLLSLNELRIHAHYKPDPVRGDPLLQSCSSRIRGRVLLVKSINSDSQFTYSDHRWAGPERIAGPSSSSTSSVASAP